VQSGWLGTDGASVLLGAENGMVKHFTEQHAPAVLKRELGVTAGRASLRHANIGMDAMVSAGPRSW
jgi:hypothetical protein